MQFAPRTRSELVAIDETVRFKVTDQTTVHFSSVCSSMPGASRKLYWTVLDPPPVLCITTNACIQDRLGACAALKSDQNRQDKIIISHHFKGRIACKNLFLLVVIINFYQHDYATFEVVSSNGLAILY